MSATGRRPGRSAIIILPIRPAANGAPAPRSNSRPRLTCCTGSPILAPASARIAATVATARMGGGTPPILTDRGWLTLWHGVEPKEVVGIYRTYWSILDKDDPSVIIASDAHTAARGEPGTDPPARAPNVRPRCRLHDRHCGSRRRLCRRVGRGGPRLPHNPSPEERVRELTAWPS